MPGQLHNRERPLELAHSGGFPSLVIGWRGKSTDELPRVNAKGSRDLEDVVKAQVRLPSLDLTQVGPVEAGALRQAFLAESERFSLCSHTRPEVAGCLGQRRLGGGGHGNTSSVLGQIIQRRYA